MALPQFVVRRGQQLYYRRAFPQQLWPVTGKAAFSKSLRTADPAQALRARPAAERLYTQRVDEARAELARRRAMPALTKADAEALAVRWFLEALDNLEAFRKNTPECVQVNAERARERAGEARRALAEGDADLSKARRLRDEAGFAPDLEAERALARLLGRASVAADEVEAGRALGRYGCRPSDPLFASAMDAPPPVAPAQAASNGAPAVAPTRTVVDLIKAYREARFGRYSAATKRAYEPVFRVLRELVGSDAQLATLTHEDGDRLFAAIQSIPTNAQKRKATRGLPLRKQIEEGKRLGLPTLSPKTVNDSYLAHLNALFGFAKVRGWMPFNPLAGRRMKEEVAAGDKREPFKDRLPVLFGAAPWSPKDASEPVRYYGPLLALFHGLRLAEIVGLRAGDVGTEQGHPMIYIRAGERGLKGRGSRRDLPMHPELVRLGLADYATKRRKAGGPDAMLFAGERPNERGQWGRKLGQWFVGRVKELGLEGRKLTLHALRHDFRDALREAGIEEPLAEYLFGHARKGLAAIYGGERPYPVVRLAEAIGKVRYDGLTLPAE
jgi:integrase